jgi:hypothetical protein
MVALVLACACSPALYIPTLVEADRTGISTESLMQGRNTYVKHCGSCHNLYLPEQFTQKHWQKEFPEMQLKAKISDAEIQLISNFILGRSKPE